MLTYLKHALAERDPEAKGGGIKEAVRERALFRVSPKTMIVAT